MVLFLPKTDIHQYHTLLFLTRHSTQKMPPKAFLYAIPKKLYTEKKIRRFGFHGSSHEYVFKRSAELLMVDQARFSCITCHLGNGVSLSAIENGRCIDTTMGFYSIGGCSNGNSLRRYRSWSYLSPYSRWYQC